MTKTTTKVKVIILHGSVLIVHIDYMGDDHGQIIITGCNSTHESFMGVCML